VSRQPEWVRAFRDTWEKGIHSYLTYLRDRLTVARDLLTVRGSIFVQIGDDNVHLVRSLMDEVFGAANFVSQITFQTTSGFDTETIRSVADFLLWYAKDKDSVKVRSLYQKKGTILGKGTATWLLLPDGTFRGVKVKEKRGEVPIPDGALLYKPGDLTGQGASTNPQPFTHEGKTYEPNPNAHWKANYPKGMERLATAGRIHVAENSIHYRRFDKDFAYRIRGNIWTDTATGSFTDEKIFVVQTNRMLTCCYGINDVLVLRDGGKGCIILDPAQHVRYTGCVHKRLLMGRAPGCYQHRRGHSFI